MTKYKNTTEELLEITREEQKARKRKELIGGIVSLPFLLLGLWIFFSILSAA